MTQKHTTIKKERTMYCDPVVTLKTRSRALVADDRALNQTSTTGGNHHGLGCLGLDGQGRLAVGLNQGVDWEALGLHGDPLGVHLQLSKASSQHFFFPFRCGKRLMECNKICVFFMSCERKRYFTQDNKLHLSS